MAQKQNIGGRLQNSPPASKQLLTVSANPDGRSNRALSATCWQSPPKSDVKHLEYLIKIMPEEYKAKEHDRQVQRFIFPLYLKDGRGGFDFSSTATFATYKNRFFCIFAAHALKADETTVENIGMLTTDGDFLPLSVACRSYKIYRDHDIVICVSDIPFEPRYHFDLECIQPTTDFNNEALLWIGFPQKKAVKAIHNSKASPDKVVNYLSVGSDGRPQWSHAKFLIIQASLTSKSESKITGRFENKSINYENEGFKLQGYSPVGMSGGPLFHYSKDFSSNSTDIFGQILFAGIGLEYDGEFIKGANKDLIVSLVEDALEMEITQPHSAILSD